MASGNPYTMPRCVCGKRIRNAAYCRDCKKRVNALRLARIGKDQTIENQLRRAVGDDEFDRLNASGLLGKHWDKPARRKTSIGRKAHGSQIPTEHEPE